MRAARPRVFFIAETVTHRKGAVSDDPMEVQVGLQSYLDLVGAPDWKTDAESGCERLVEEAGRLCYRSWEPGLNPNVTRVRRGNAEYLDHVIAVGHGSVLEHSYATFIFHDVSRVFTHELVRHRAGCANSQESMRFVRLDDMPFWQPDADPDLLTPEQRTKEKEVFEKSIRASELCMKELEKVYGFDDQNMSFDRKKKLTSRMRRIAPDGVATGIVWTANMRTIRHVLEMRTAPEAEEEIRLVFGIVGKFAKVKWPNLFADYKEEVVDGQPWFRTEHKKV